MCASALAWSSIDTICFSVPISTLETYGSTLGFRCEEIINRRGNAKSVVGPVLETEGICVHEAYWNQEPFAQFTY